MADKITNDITLLFKTQLDEKSKQEVGKNLKGLLENAVIGFDEAEIKKNLQPIIRMMKMMFDKAEMKFDADKLLGMPSRQALQEVASMTAEQFQIAFDRALAKSGGVKIDFGNVDLSGMTEPLERVAEELSEISRKIANDTKKSVDEIELALDRLNKKGTAKRSKTITEDGVKKKITNEVVVLEEQVSKVEETLNKVNGQKALTTTKGAIAAISAAAAKYEESVTKDDPWEIQYQYMVDFVSKYEAMSKKIKPFVEAQDPKLKSLYDILSPKAGAAKISLEHFVDVARGNELSEYKNQPWARESTLKKVEQVLRNGITVKDGGDSNRDDDQSNESPKPASSDSGDGDNNKKLNTKVPVNDDSAFDAERATREALVQQQRIVAQKIEKTERQLEDNNKRIEEIKKDIATRASFKMYKGIGSDGSAELEDRVDVYNAYGADYYTSDIDAALEYASDEESHVVVAEIAPKDPLVFDAKQYVESGDYGEVISSLEFLDDLKAKLKEKFSQTVSSEKQLKKMYEQVDKLSFAGDETADASQKKINTFASSAGFDSVVFDNVLDYASNMIEAEVKGERASAKRKTGKTIAVLKDEILKIIGFHKVEETESGLSISEELLTEIPEHYFMPEQETEDGNSVPQAISEISEGLKEKIDLESQVAEIEKQNKKLQKELDSLRSEVKNIDASSFNNDGADSSVSKTTTDTMTGTLQKVKQFSGLQNKEYMTLIGADASTDIVGGEEFSVPVEELIAQLIANVKNTILMSLHNHPDDMLAFTPSDIASYGKLYKTQGIDIHGIVADGIIQTIDFTGIAQETILQIAQSYADNLSDAASKSNGLFSYIDGELKVSDEMQELADLGPEAREKIKSELQFVINNALSKAFSDNNLKSTVQTFDSDNLSKLSEYLLQVGQNAKVAVDPVEKLNALTILKDQKNTTNKIKAESVAHQENTASIVAEANASEKLNDSLEDRSNIENSDNGKADIVEADAETEAINRQNEALKENVALQTQTDGKSAGHVSGSELDTTNEQTQLANLKGSVDDVTGAVNAKTQAFKDEGVEVGKVIDGEIEKLDTLEDRISATKDALTGLINNIETDADNVSSGLGNITVNVNHKKEEDAEQTVSINQDSLKSTLENIVYNVKLTHDDTDKESNKIAIDEGTLKSVLEKITYNVSVVRDDDNLDNKVVVGDNKDAPDQSTGDNKEVRSQWQNDISTLLTRIKVHTHNTVRQLRDNVAPKILEAKAQDTDAGLKSILEQIRNNTAKIGTMPQTPANDSDSILSQISKNVLEINGKIVKGTKAPNKDAAKIPKIPAGRDAQILAERKATQRLSLDKFKAELETSGKMTEDVAKKIRGLAISLGMVKDSKGLTRWGEKFKQEKLRVGIDTVEQKDAVAEEKRIEAEKIALRKQYQELGVLEARAEEKKTEEANARLEQLRQEIVSKQESLNISEEELRVLQQLKEDSKADELDILGSKQADKDTKKQTANAKKMAQREAMLGKAGNAVGRAENTWMNAVGIEGELPADFVAEIDNYYQKLDELRKKHQELKNSDMISEEQKKELIGQTMSINKMTEEIGELVSEYQRLSGDNATVIGTNTLDSGAGLDAYEQQLKQTVMTATHGKAQIKNFDAATKTLTYTVKTGKNEFTEYTAAVRRADGALVSVQGATKRTETFIEATKRKMKELTSYMSGMALFSRAGQELRRGIQYVREIDLALTELKKVTNETEEEYDQFLKTAAKTGARLGTTISAVTEATSTFAKLGYTIEQATEMAESAIVYKNVGDNIESTGDAADSIISTMKGFGLEASESMAIVDRFNEVGNRFAITSQGIGEALRLSASALSEGGNSLDESIGLITAANEVVNDPSSVGTALKTLTLRLRGSKTELEEMGEDVTDMATTTSQLQAELLALTGGQVDIMLDANTFKNSTQILREMADAWEDMNDIQRASALELMGGRLLPLCIEICT